jgi:CDP-diacylglycerol--glycerol-3-phosphate 3-phosphatidyltransferase
MQKRSYYIINGITVYRIAAAPFLLYLVLTRQYDTFKWFLGISFFTDLIDGFLARRFKVTSRLGTRLDSIGDDLTIVVAIIGLSVFKPEFFKAQIITLSVLLLLFLVQIILSLLRYGKMTSFHTYLAKFAAILQGSFLLLLFFTDNPNLFLFYFASFVTGLELVEEIILVVFLKNWKTNVKGLYWVRKNKNETS